MASSIRLGIRALEVAAPDAEGVLLMTCDQPAVTVKHLSRLRLRGAEVKASRYAGKNGVPAFFPAKYFATLMKLEGNAGERELLADAGLTAQQREG